MDEFTFSDTDGVICRYCNGVYDGVATPSELQLLETLKKNQDAIQGIASWLSASLSDTDACEAYVDACERIFEADERV